MATQMVEECTLRRGLGKWGWLSATIVFLVANAVPVSAAVYYAVGSSGFSWPTTWVALPGTNTDLNDGLGRPQVDFVGDASNPVGYYEQSNTYIAFRMRVAYSGTVDGTTFADSLFVLIDRVGYGNEGGLPDYALVWDSTGAVANHGLEMLKYSASTGSWDSVTMTDVDGSDLTKGTNDINGGGRTTDGYVRTVDGQATTALGTTTFVDFAVAWKYLDANTTLSPLSQQWKITFASVSSGSDANPLTGDISGGANPGDLVAANPWSSSITTNPEPGSMALLGLGSAGMLWWQRRRGKKKPTQADSTAA